MKKLTLLTVSIRNFQSYGNSPTIIDLNTGKATFVMGVNKDTSNEHGVTSNGSGKTTVLHAITFALYGKIIGSKDIVLDDLVNNINKKNMEVILTFKAPDDQIYSIRRTRKFTGVGNSVFITDSAGKDITPSSVALADQYIEKHFLNNASFDLFTRMVVISPSQIPFLSLPTRSTSQANQSDMLELLFGLTILSEKAEVLKDEIKTVEKQIDEEQVRIDTLQAAKTKYEQTLANLKQKMDSHNQVKQAAIETLKTKITESQSINVTEQLAYHQQLDTLNLKKSELMVPANKIKTTISDLQRQIDDITTQVQSLSDSKCPYCHQHYNEGLEKAKLLTEQLPVLTNQLESAKQQQSTILNDVREVLVKITELNTLIMFDKPTLQSVNASIDRLSGQLMEVEQSNNPYIEAYHEFSKQTPEDISYDKINELTIQKEHLKFLYKLLTAKNSFVRKHLLAEKLGYLNAQTKNYLQNIGLPHKVEFSEDMEAKITLHGREISYGSLSSGQRARINLAQSFAFSDVQQQSILHINFQALDEVLDTALDVVGMQAAIKMIKNRAIANKHTTFIISHKQEAADMFDSKIVVTYEHGFSSI